MDVVFKPLGLQRVATPLNRVDFGGIEKESLPFLRRKSDTKILSGDVKTEDIVTKGDIEKLKEDIARKEEATKRKIERLKKEFSYYQLEMDVELMLKDSKIAELENKINQLQQEIMKKEEIIAKQNQEIENQKKAVIDQTTEYMKRLNEFASEKKKAEQEYSKSLARTVHDMKNPLTGIKCGLEILIEDETINEHQRQILNLAYASGLELSYMIEEILLNNKLVHNAIELKKETIDLAEEVRNLYERNKIAASRTGRKLSFSCKEKIVIKCDKNRMKRAIENIMLNAIKYCNTSVSISVEKMQKEVHIKISDDGNGFDEDVKRKILCGKDMTTSDLINGNGFGLTNAKRIVEMHNGRISIDTGSGKGTSVNIILPDE
ncbi:MAG: ATP-binding protein [Candidatus Micrarchaeota archaeon]|nr:ATP-binding protein [Candidatus Micrarchaeota archaeon]